MLFASAQLEMRGDRSGDLFLAAKAEVGRTQPALDVIILILAQIPLTTRHAINQVELGIRHHLHQPLDGQLSLFYSMKFLNLVEA